MTELLNERAALSWNDSIQIISRDILAMQGTILSKEDSFFATK